jgi:RNA polymerase sigma-70 factor (ECF subfamily)
LLVGMARRGDRGAFAELVRQREPWIRNLMRRLCGNESLAQDLAQDAFMQAWRNVHRLRQARKFSPWLKRIAVNTWLQHLRKRDLLRLAENLEELTAAREDTAGIGMDLDSALSLLSPQQRLCLVLFYNEGMTHDEIARLTTLPTGTVKSHIRRGNQRMKKQLSAYVENSREV